MLVSFMCLLVLGWMSLDLCASDLMRLCVRVLSSDLRSGEGRQGEAAEGQGPSQDAAQHHHQEVPLW